MTMEEHSIDKNIPSTFKLMRNFFSWSYENPEIVNTNVTAIYMFILDHHSRLGFKEKFGLPTVMTMEAVGIKNYKTYKYAMDILVEYGFIQVIEQSKNQYSSNVIAVVKNTKAHTNALGKATTKHVQSSVDIDKLKNLRTKEYINDEFEQVWATYGKVGSKKKALEIWEKMDNDKRQKISISIPGYKKHLTKTGYAPKHFTTYLNSDEYENYLNISTSTGGEIKQDEIVIYPCAANNFDFSLIKKFVGKTKEEFYQVITENREECRKLYQCMNDFDDDDMYAFRRLHHNHPYNVFIQLYYDYCHDIN